MHDMTINERFREDEALIAGLNEAKLDKSAFDGEDYQGMVVNDIRVALNAQTEKFELFYTVTKPVTGEHEKKIIPLDSPNNSVAVYMDATRLHIVSAPPVDNESIEYTEDGKLKIKGLTAVDDVTIHYNDEAKLEVLEYSPTPPDDVTIHLNDAGALEVIDGAIGESKLSESVVEQLAKVAELESNKANKIFIPGEGDADGTYEDLVDVKAALQQDVETLDEKVEANETTITQNQDAITLLDNNKANKIFVTSGTLPDITGLLIDAQPDDYVGNVQLKWDTTPPSAGNSNVLLTKSNGDILLFRVAPYDRPTDEEPVQGTRFFYADANGTETNLWTDYDGWLVGETVFNIDATLTSMTTIESGTVWDALFYTAEYVEIGLDTVQDLVDVKQELQANIEQVIEEKQDKSPLDGIPYWLKGGTIEPVNPAEFGIVQSVDGLTPVDGEITLNAAHIFTPDMGDTPLDLEDVYNLELLKTDADFHSVTSVIPRKMYDTTVLEENTKNPVSGIIGQNIRYIPTADAVNSGLMPRSAVTALSQALSDIEVLKGVGRVSAHLGLTPAQDDFDNAWKSGKNTQTVTEGATVVNIDQDPPLGHSWTYLIDADTGDGQWVDRGTDVVNMATNAAPGIVQGTENTQGKVAVEADGSMSVNGWAENISGISITGIAASTGDYGTTAAGSLKTLLLGIMNKIKGLFSFFTNGSAKTAVQLLTARAFLTNLASTASATFNGTAANTHGVTGTLQLANGGTGVTSKAALINLMHSDFYGTPASSYYVSMWNGGGNGGYITPYELIRTALDNYSCGLSIDTARWGGQLTGRNGVLNSADGGICIAQSRSEGAGLYLGGNYNVEWNPADGVFKYHVDEDVPSSYISYINTSGGITINCDRRLKNNIKPFEQSALEIILKLEVVTFKWKTDAYEASSKEAEKTKNTKKYNRIQRKIKKRTDTTHVGFIAQDVQKVLPDLIAEGGEGGYLGMSKEELVPYLVAAIQELKSEVDDLKARIAS